MSQATLKSIDGLINEGLVTPEARDTLERVQSRFAVAIPPHLRRHMARLRDASPIYRQYVPTGQELESHPFETDDPIGDQAHTPLKGIVHRYHNRVLLKVVSICPVYCRFCFRRAMIGPDSDGLLSGAEVDRALNYISSKPQIEEVIMTGGDPLILAPRRIKDLTTRLSQIPHVKKLRWHSRVPVVAPERITHELLMALSETDRAVRIAVHANHAQEFDAKCQRACHDLQSHGITLLSQSVLLAGVNATIESLAALFKMFRTLEIQPYYLHQLDLAPGTHHFRVAIKEAQTLLQGVRRHAPDLERPRYMLDIPGGNGKIDIEDREQLRAVAETKSGTMYRIRDPFGRVHTYCDPHLEERVRRA